MLEKLQWDCSRLKMLLRWNSEDEELWSNHIKIQVIHFGKLGDACQDSRRTSHAGKTTQVSYINNIFTTCTNYTKFRNEKTFSIEARKITYKQRLHFIFIYSYTAIQCSGPPSKSGKDTRGFYIQVKLTPRRTQTGKTQVFKCLDGTSTCFWRCLRVWKLHNIRVS